MADKQYVYAVARIRSKELSLLSGAFLEQLTAAKDYDECIQLLMEKGWGEDGITNAGDILAIEKRKTWELINELVKDMSVFDVFLYANDYHNLKAAIKEVRMGDEYPGIFMDQGTVDVKLIREAVQTREFQNLPAAMRTPAEEAYKALLHTQDGQLCDIIIDKAALDAIYAAGKSSGNEFLELYAELTVAAADIKTAVRASRTGKDRVFLEQALAPCGSINVARLAQAAIEGVDSIGSYLETTAYADAVEELRRSPSAFERWCDNLLIRKIKPQQYSAFGLGPLAAYILARENEIKSVRIVLSGKLNHLPEESIRERIREMYGFASLGLEPFPLTDPAEAGKKVKDLAESGYAVIYITEALAAQIEPEINRYREAGLPAIILIPGISGNTGKGILAVKKSVEQAVGSDIIFNGQ